MTTKIPEGDIYRTSRIMYIIEAMVENFITILTIGAYLASLTKALGISDGMTAVLSSITSLTGLFQLVSIYLSHKTPIKRWVIPVQLFSHLLFCGLYLLPLFDIKRGAGVIFFVLTIVAQALKSIISPIKVNWFFSMVDSKRRGSFTAVLTAISVVGGIFFSLFAGWVFDSYNNAGNTRGAFIALTVMIFVITVMDIIPLILSREKERPVEKAPSPFESMRSIFKNARFRNLTLIATGNAIALAIAPPFLGTYQISELGFSLTYVAFCDMVVYVFWTVALLLFGRLSCHKPYAFVLRIAFAIDIISYVLLIFTVPLNGAVMFLAYRIVRQISGSASAVSYRNLIFDVVPEEERTSALSVSTIISGVIGFLVTLCMTPLVGYIQRCGFSLFGCELYAQQLLAIISLIIMLITNVALAACYKQLRIEH